jgi:ubiquitin-protein ligase E3 C
MTEVELVRGGSQIPVTNENKLHYIALYCNYMLNVRTQAQTRAFTQGLKTVIPE